MRAPVALGLGATALLFALLPSCSSDDDSGGGACGQYFDQLSAYYQRCDLADAAQFQNARDRFLLYCQNLLTAPGTEKLPGLFVTCGAQLATLPCDEDFDCGDQTGSLADGAPCGEDVQCQSGDCSGDHGQCGKCQPRVPVGSPCSNKDRCVEHASCSFDNGDTGTCVADRIAKAGESCKNDDVRCDTGLHCSFAEPSSPVCAAPGAQGAACQSEADCGPTLRCVAKVCTPAPTAGQDCNGGFGACAAGLGCGADRKCAPVTYVAGGQPCDDLVRRCARGRCKGAMLEGGPNGTLTVDPGTCEDPLPDGAPCQEDDGTGDDDPPRCDDLANCVNGTCQLENAANCK